ncbi:MAG: ABC transporter ATP-binding protein/permease [Clostridia bacterium]|nr:ABC transporter ATP-binding protein/permease [Clostridia bacterium]
MANKKKVPKLTREQRRKTIKNLLIFARPFLPLFVLAFIFAAASSIMAHYIPVLVGEAIDNMADMGKVDFAEIESILPIILILTLGGAALDWIIRLIGNRAGASISRDIRSACIRKLERLPLSYLDSHPAGDTLSRVIADTDHLSEGLLTGMLELYSSVLGIIVTLVFMLSINVKVGLVVALLTPLSMLVSAFIAGRTFSLFREQSVMQAKQTALLDESVSGRDVISAFSHEADSLAEFDVLNEEYRRTATKATFFSSITNPATRFVNSLVYCGVALVGGLIAITSGGSFSAGQLSCLLTYSHNYAKPFNELSGVVTELQGALASAMRVFEFLETPDETPDAPDSTPLTDTEISGGVTSTNVYFSYTDKPFMENLNFSVCSGQRVAIVGPTGCGKTTLINLLMRFYEVTGGAIRIGERDIREVPRDSLRADFGMVLQDTWLSSGTVRDNIVMGKPDATDEEVERAARAAHAHTFISKLPQGYDTILGEDGGKLSQGQKQLLCITRVMLALPPMLILDEATSSIDTRTEIKISEAFAQIMRGRTSFIVAHRLNTIKNADLILVMRDGCIVEQGTHDELMSRKGGFYAELYGAQFKGIKSI